MKLELSEDEAQILMDLIGQMNYYETAAILCKTHNGQAEIESVMGVLHQVYNKIERLKGDEKE